MPPECLNIYELINNRVKCLKDNVNLDVSDIPPDRNSRNAVEGTSCSVENVFENHLKVGRSLEAVESLKMVEVKGQKIYGLFTSHLNPHISNPIFEILPLLFENGEQQEEAYEELRDILHSHSDTVKSERADVLTIVKLLRDADSNLKWIGVEASENELKEDPIQHKLSHYRGFKFFLENVLTPEEIEKTLYLTFSAYIIALAEYPALFKSPEFIPLEDNIYARESTNLYREGKRILEELYFTVLSAATESDKSVEESIEDVDKIEFIAGRAIVNVRKIPQQVISDELNNWQDEKIRSLVARLFENTNQFIEYILKRDQAMASAILSQSGNGLILLGAAHAEGITQRLLSACRGLQ